MIDSVYETILKSFHLLNFVLNLYRRRRILGRQGYFYFFLSSLATPTVVVRCVEAVQVESAEHVHLVRVAEQAEWQWQWHLAEH